MINAKTFYRVALVIIVMGLLTAHSNRVMGIASSKTDKLAYMISVEDKDGKFSSYTLKLYDPVSRTSKTVLTGLHSWRFVLSADGRIALPMQLGKVGQVYVIDTRNSNTLVRIGVDKDANETPLVWSLDSKYLAVVSNSTDFAWSRGGKLQANDSNSISKPQIIYVWDGKTFKDVTPPPELINDKSISTSSYIVEWREDNQLSIVSTYTDLNLDRVSHFYLWDGQKTIRLTAKPIANVEDYGWSKDGRLAIKILITKDSDILVWDGKSYKDDYIDTDTFINVTPELTTYYTFPVWASTGDLSFIAQGPQDTHLQIYLWNERRVKNISQNPEMHNDSQGWTKDGRWVFSTFYSPEQKVYVRSADNKTLFETDGQYPRWSADGQLSYCLFDYNKGWTLFVWDGQQTVAIDTANEIEAQWHNGQGTPCSSG